MPGLSGRTGEIYDLITDYAATVVFLCMVVAAVRRLIFKPARYAVPAKYGKAHTADAIFLLGLIATSDGCRQPVCGQSFCRPFTAGPAGGNSGRIFSPVDVADCCRFRCHWPHSGASTLALISSTRSTFYFLLCYRPFGIQFHVETSLFSIYFSKLERGTLKPVRWGVPDEHLDQVKSFGVKTFEDFTWKHMLDFYSCADCGRCADNCPANTVGRPLAPRFLTIKARDYVFQHYPVLGKANNSKPLIGNIYSEDEIWSCTTCGACEEECPLLVEYIDKIVDLRRGMIDDGNVPQSLQKPLKALESRGNPYGKIEKKRGDWAKSPEFAQDVSKSKFLTARMAPTLCTSSTASLPTTTACSRSGEPRRGSSASLGKNFGILGAAEKDSGHEVRRFGEEMLFMALRDHNTEAIKASGVAANRHRRPARLQRAETRL